jgi:selenocysteine-specific elongation factor
MLEPPSIELSLQALLISEGRLIRSTQGICFTQENYENLKTKISNYIKDHGSITVAEARDLFSTSRKYALAILECLDEQKITRRNGDARILL